jgi:hypothetical protein
LRNSYVRIFDLEVYKQKTEILLDIGANMLLCKLVNFLFVCMSALTEDVVVVVD